jgi:hypothetical protein
MCLQERIEGVLGVHSNDLIFLECIKHLLRSRISVVEAGYLLDVQL